MKTLQQIIALIATFFTEQMNPIIWVKDENGTKLLATSDQEEVKQYLQTKSGVYNIEFRKSWGTTTKLVKSQVVQLTGNTSMQMQGLGMAENPLQINQDNFGMHLSPLAQFMVRTLEKEKNEAVIKATKLELELKAAKEKVEEQKDLIREMNHSNELSGIAQEQKSGLSGLMDKAMENPEAIATLVEAVGGLLGKIQPSAPAQHLLPASNLSEMKKLSLNEFQNWINTTSEEEAIAFINVLNYASRNPKLMQILNSSLNTQSQQGAQA